MTMNITTYWIDKPWSIRVEINNIEKKVTEEIAFLLPVEKVLLSKVHIGDRIAMDSIVDEGNYFRNLIERGKEFKNTYPVSDRINNILQYLHKILKYPYHSDIQEEPNYKEIKEFYYNNPSNLPLSECIEYGYGKCAQFGILFAIIAQAADLQVTYNQVAKKTLKNIKRPDTKEHLFKSVSLGIVDEHHVYNSVLVNDKYVPVDPTRKLNGMYLPHQEIFKMANYEEYKSLLVKEKDTKSYLGSSYCTLGLYQQRAKLRVKLRPSNLQDNKNSAWASNVIFKLVPWMDPNPAKILSKNLELIC